MHPAIAALALLLTAAPAAAGPHLRLTGYASVLAVAYSDYEREPAALFPEPSEHFFNPGFRIDGAGLFAASQVSEDATFLMDVNFRGIGASVDETRVQYAYLDAALPWAGLRAQAGKVKVPFNHYNDHRFYPFQRVGLSPPFAISSALGLPLADPGVVVASERELGGEWLLKTELYAVNGFGHSPGATTTLRSPLLPRALGMRRNLRANNSNKDVAVGGRLRAVHDRGGEGGVSYYRGAWDPEGRRLLQLAGAHALLKPGRLDLLVEYLHMRADGDEGMAASFGATSWQTHGAFVTASHPLLTLAGREVVGHARGEAYASGRVGGGPGKEVLRSAGVGLASCVSEAVTLKAEHYWVSYALPVTGSPSINVEARSLQAALVVTF